MGAAEAEEERSPKGQRTETNASEIDFVRDKDFYLDDGNIIIVAEDTAFKIHKSVLSRHSVVFHDMFLLATGNTPSSESHESCDVLRLSDSKKDIVCLLQALYDVIAPSSDKPVELSCLLRISHKYLIHRLLKRILETMEKAIPITYEDYKVFFDTLGTPGSGYNELAFGITTTGIDIFLPILYYRLSTCRDPSKLEILPASSIARILTGIPHILECLPDFLKIVKARKSVSGACLSLSPTCKDVLSDLLERNMASPQSLYCPFDFMIFLCGRDLPGQCSSCKDARISLMEAEARKIWDRLPKIYNVAESWDELREKYNKFKESVNEDSQQ